ncbi:MAG: hypothetical protein ACK4MG_04235 [Aquabacterium sp.]
MQPLTKLKLGDFTFSGTEIPEAIVFGGQQALVVHRLVGGRRIIDAMGRDDAALDWSGVLFGSEALARARYLDWLRISGQQLDLSWSELSYRVVVRSFSARYQLANHIPYSISCEVVEQTSQPVRAAPPAGADVAIQQDMAEASRLGAQIGDGPLSQALASLDSAIKAVSSFAGAAQSTIGSVVAPIQAVQARVQVLVGAAGSTLANVTTLGGIVPNNPISRQVAALAGQAAAMQQTPLLLQLQAVTARMQANVGLASSGQSITTAGGNLFKLAADLYGDAAEWATLARANKLSDPVLTGVQTLTVPAKPDGNGGVPRA